MNQPPPQGWHQQQQGSPSSSRRNRAWPNSPPGYGYPQGPPKKSKAPLVIGILAGLAVLGGAITVLVLYFGANKDGGTTKRAGDVAAACANISEDTLKKARTTNPNALGSRESDLDRGKRTICTWSQTKGEDGAGLRNTNVHVTEASKEPGEIYQDGVKAAMANNQGKPQQKPLEGLGDEATAVLVETSSAFTEVTIIARKGDSVVEVSYLGLDAGFLSPKRPRTCPELKAAAMALTRTWSRSLNNEGRLLSSGSALHHRELVGEVAGAGEVEGHAGLLGLGDRLGVAHRTAGLHDRAHARVPAAPRGRPGTGRTRRTRPTAPLARSPARFTANPGVDAVDLAHADADGGTVVRQQDRVRLDRADQEHARELQVRQRLLVAGLPAASVQFAGGVRPRRRWRRAAAAADRQTPDAARRHRAEAPRRPGCAHSSCAATPPPHRPHRTER